MGSFVFDFWFCCCVVVSFQSLSLLDFVVFKKEDAEFCSNVHNVNSTKDISKEKCSGFVTEREKETKVR